MMNSWGIFSLTSVSENNTAAQFLKMKIYLTLLMLLGSWTIIAQQFEVDRAYYDGESIAAKGEIVVDIAKKSITLNINSREIILSKMTFKKGEIGELICYKESIETKQRFKFSPYKNEKENLPRITHILTHTIIQGFSNRKTEYVFYLIKKRPALKQR